MEDIPGSKFIGKFRLESQENFDEFLKAVGGLFIAF